MLGSGWAWLPVLVWLAGFARPAQAFVLFPACIGVGVLLLVHVADLVREER